MPFPFGRGRALLAPAMTGTRKRGRSTRVPPEWLLQIRAWQGDRSIRDMGAELAKVMGRDTPISPSRIHAYLSGQTATVEMTDAFARAMGAPPPVITAPLDDPEIARWCDVGRRLKAQHRERFQDELRVLAELVDMLESTSRRHPR